MKRNMSSYASDDGIMIKKLFHRSA